MIIYSATNKINGKQYIGQTTKTLDERSEEHWKARYSFKTYFKKALIKYGKKNFIWKILYKCKTVDELNQKEIVLIKKFNTLSPNGYNLTVGGKGSGQHIEETKRIIREKLMGNQYAKGHKCSKVAKKKMSENHKGKTLKELGHRLNCLCCMCRAARGEMKGSIPWNRGLTKEINKSVAAQAKKMKNRKLSIGHKRKLSKAAIGKSLEERGHKLGCLCCICKAKKGKKRNN